LRIEQQQRRISMIHENLDGPCSEIEPEENTNNPGAQYNMGEFLPCAHPNLSAME
jgi:hypothetical protein